jgi:hypothetical protein
MTPEPAAVQEALKVARQFCNGGDDWHRVIGCKTCERLAQAMATYAAAQREALRDSLEPGTPERIFVGLMDECTTRGIGSPFSARHVVSQIMEHVDNLTAQLAAAEEREERRLRAMRQECEDLIEKADAEYDALQAALVAISNVPCGDKSCNAALLAEAALTGSA